MKFLKELWFGNLTLKTTTIFTILPILIYIYFIHFHDLNINELSLLILLDIVGLILSFFILACVWRSASKHNGKVMIFFSRTLSILIITYFLYVSYFKWVL